MVNRQNLFDHPLVRLWPLWAALAVFGVLLVRMLLKVLDANDGYLIYALDDAYIHMSIARNFAEHGVWGVTQYEYTSSSSSPLWTLLLALTYVPFGANEISPFLLNIAASVLLLVAAYIIWRRYGVPRYAVAGGLVVLAAVTPLNPYIFTGLEHVLHAALAVIFVALGAEAIAREQPLHWNERDALLLYLTGALLAFTRYEGLFVVAAIGGLYLLYGRFHPLALYRRFRFTLMLGVLAALPVALYGLIAMSYGWPFLPASVVLKSESSLDALRNIDSIIAALGWLWGMVTSLFDMPLFLAAVGVAVALVILRLFVPPLYDTTPQNRHIDAPSVMLVAVIGVILVHLRLLTDNGLFERYIMYLLVLAIVAIGAAGGRYLPETPHLPTRALLPAAITVTVGFAVLGIRLIEHYDFLRERWPMLAATTNIYQQQYQMGRFLAEYYNDATVVANDIGAITYFTDIRLVDIFGLGTLEVAQARMDDAYTPQVMGQIAAGSGAEIGITYWHWITEMLVGEVPEGWLPVGAWGTPNVVVLGGETVTFYALTDAAVDPLVDALWDFGDELPEAVFQQHYLREENASTGG